MSSINEELINAYKEARKSINSNKDKKIDYIKEYIDLVIKFDNIMNNNPNNLNNPNNTNSELYKMLKNPLEISIYNNFQRYNDKPNKNIINPIINPIINTINNEPVIDDKVRVGDANNFLRTINPNSI
jgi:hypothetical protein